VRPSAEAVAAWLERLETSETVRITRVSETVLEFRTKSTFWTRRGFFPSLSDFGNGEVEIQDGQEGPIITVRANPPMWGVVVTPLWFIFGLVIMFGWANATAFLRWGAGLGGVLLGGFLLFNFWSALHEFLNSTAAYLRIWRTGRPYAPLPRNRGAA